MNPIAAAFFEAAETERPPVSSGPGPVGMFRIRKPITVSALVRNLLAAVQGDGSVINVVGTDIVVHRPEVITVKITGLRKYEFTPDFPVDVAVMRLGVSVNIRSIEIVTDDETGHPAVLVTTASSLKPDLIIVCDLEQTPVNPDNRVFKPGSNEVLMICNQQLVPRKHQEAILDAVDVAYGPKAIALRHVVACSNGPGRTGFDVDTADQLARAIVEDLIKEKVVSAGFLFWWQLGYWMVRIFAELLKIWHTHQNAQGYVGQSTVFHRFG